MARRDLLGETAEEDKRKILAGPIVRTLLSGQEPDGSFGVHPYHKWRGAHWRLVSLVELALPPGEPRAIAALETVFGWLTHELHRRSVRGVRGRPRSHASQEGNALAVACRLGRGDDPRSEQIARSLIEWQWPDGGWNCDRRPAAHRSSFHESLTPMWGLHEFAAATGDADAAAAARRTSELLLEHRLYRALDTGGTIHPAWIKPRWPPYWHYDILQALTVLARMGLADDPRADDAVAILRERRRPSGRWASSGRWWAGSPNRKAGTYGTVEVVDWSTGGADQMVTLNCLRVLAARSG